MDAVHEIEQEQEQEQEQELLFYIIDALDLQPFIRDIVVQAPSY